MSRPTLQASQPLRVLQVVGNSVIGGAENHVLTLVVGLKERGHTVAAVCPRPGPLVEMLHQNGIQVSLLEMVRPAPGDEYEIDLPALGSLLTLIRRWQPDIVHSHLYPAHVHATLAGELAGVGGLVTTAHTLITRPGDSALSRLTRGRVIAVSQAAKALLVAAGVPAGRIRVIYNGIESRFFADESASGMRIRRELGLEPDTLVIGVIARLSAEKNHDGFLRIARDVATHRDAARFVVVGTGPMLATLQSLVVDLGLGDRVIFTGARRDVTALNHAIDIFVLPSREEALPLAVLEAMAARRPIIASRVGGVPEVVVDGETGLLFEPDDRAGFVQAILGLADDPLLRARLGWQGRERVHRRFAVSRMVRETIGYYQSILSARNGSRRVDRGG